MQDQEFVPHSILDVTTLTGISLQKLLGINVLPRPAKAGLGKVKLTYWLVKRL